MLKRSASANAPSPGAALLNTKAVAAMLGCAEVTVRLWRYSGGGPKFVKITPRQIRYRVADVEAWLNARTIGSTSESVSAGFPSSAGRRLRAGRQKAQSQKSI